MTTNPETVQIDGKSWVIHSQQTPAQARAVGLTHVADTWEKAGATRHLCIRRPKGTRIFFAWETSRGIHVDRRVPGVAIGGAQ